MALEKEIREATKESLGETYNRLQKIEELIKMGLMPIQTLPYLKRAVTHMEQDMFLPFQERKIFYDFVEELMDIALGNPTINRLVKNQAALTKYEETEITEAKKCAYCGEEMTGEGKYCCEGCEKAAMKKEKVEQVDEVVMASKAPAKPMDDDLKAKVKADMEKRRQARQTQMADIKKEYDAASKKDLNKSYRKSAFKEDAETVSEEGLDFKRTPEGMLDSIANLMKTKLRAGGKVSPSEKRLASRAKTELRRRRDVQHKRDMRESVEYRERLKLGMEKFNIKAISELTADNKEAFFNYVENSQGE